MLKVFILFLLPFINFSSCFSQNSRLIIYSEERNAFYVTFGEIKQNIEAWEKVKINDINLSALDIQIEFKNPDLPKIEKLINILPENVMIFRIEKNRKGQLVLSQINEDSIDPEKFNQGLNIISFKKPNSSDYYGPIGCPFPTILDNLNKITKSIKSYTDPDEKFSYIKQIIATNCFYSGQVKEIIKMIVDEEYKVELAKYAYSYTYDIGYYYKVNDCFEFESSKEELFEYLNSK